MAQIFWEIRVTALPHRVVPLKKAGGEIESPSQDLQSYTLTVMLSSPDTIFSCSFIFTCHAPYAELAISLFVFAPLALVLHCALWKKHAVPFGLLLCPRDTALWSASLCAGHSPGVVLWTPATAQTPVTLIA